MAPEANLSVGEIESYRHCVGRSLVETDTVSVDVIRRIAAALDASWNHSAPLEPMWHYGLFPSTIPTAQLASDGHAPRGPFMPPVRLPRRMFAGSDIRFLGELKVGREAVRRQSIASVDHRRGRSGELVFVGVRSTVTQDDVACIEEEQTIVYRAAGARVAPVTAAPQAPLQSDEQSRDWKPTTVELFRFSCATFNSHRIHYDLRYAMDEEGYPGLVVHGPLTATRLCEFGEAIAGRRPASFAFRGEAPLFVDQPLRLVGRIDGSHYALRALRADGNVAMSATFS